MKKIPITEAGYLKLKEELNNLKKNDRPKNIKAIEVARAHGDLSENAEYHAAKERQSFIAGRIADLDFKIANAEIININNILKDRVVFGSTVLLENVDTGEESQYQLVGEDEADMKEGKISILSPLGKAIIGKKPSDEIVFNAPIGRRVYELISIL